MAGHASPFLKSISEKLGEPHGCGKARFDMRRGRQVGAVARDGYGGRGHGIAEQVADRRQVEFGDRFKREPVGFRKLGQQRGVRRVASTDCSAHGN